MVILTEVNWPKTKFIKKTNVMKNVILFAMTRN